MQGDHESLDRPRLVDLPDVLYVHELARFLGISERAVRHHIDQGHIQAIRLGARILIPKRNVEAWMAGEEVKSTRGVCRPSVAR